MPRLDARIKTQVPARVLYHVKDATREERALMSELSLSSALLDGLQQTNRTVLILKAELPGLQETELLGEVMRQWNGRIACRFYYSDVHVRTNLWKHIKKYLPSPGRCLYCGATLNPWQEYCPNCGWLLNFEDTDYLEKHARETFFTRIQSRAVSCTAEQMGSVTNFIDAELLKGKTGFLNEEFVGTSAAMQQVFSFIERVAMTDMNVLILGESGTGKELAARAIHSMGRRRHKPFVTVNCAAIPEGLLEAELFGHERGSFTGAYNSRKGKFECADGGTLFLDEIGDMPINLQAKILRFLQERVIERIGATQRKKIDVRLIAATNIDLAAAIQEEKFRHDLYYRLDEFSIGIPPVRQRGFDSVILAKHFLHTLGRDTGTTKRFTTEAIEALKSYHWPGNVREIINKVKRAIVVSDDMLITSHALGLTPPSHVLACDGEEHRISLKGIKNDVERRVLLQALERSGNNVSEAAKILGLSRTSLYNLKKKYSL